jgi:hypothetical protein
VPVSGAVVGWAINNYEPVFQLGVAVVLFYRVLIEAKGKFPFEMRGLVIGNEWLSFYIKPADGYQLPEIMQRSYRQHPRRQTSHPATRQSTRLTANRRPIHRPPLVSNLLFFIF